MSSKEYKGGGPEVPIEFGKLKLKAVDTKSAGLPAVWSAGVKVVENMTAGSAVKTLFKLNQKGGIDCPGCAWPDPDDDRSALGEYCENGVKAIAEEAMRRQIDAGFFRKHTVSELAKMTDYELGKLGRLAEPLVLHEGSDNYTSISWSEAYRLIARHLHELSSPDEAIFYTSGRTSNEAAFLYQLFVRAYGTNNLPDCSNMCHESSGKALSETLGIGKGSVTLKDMHEAEVIIIMGQNPGTNHPRMLSALEKCKHNGGKIISVNPLPEAGLINFTDPQSPLKILKGGTDLTDVFLQIKVNEDVALLKAWLCLLLKAEEQRPGEVFEWSFIKSHTKGIDSLIEHLKTQDAEALIAQTGIPKDQVLKAFDLILNHKKIIICWAMGLTQHKNAVDNIRELVNLLLLKGSIGKPGAGTCPVRGHSNVQGDRTMGIWEEPKPEFLDALKETFDFEPPRQHGFAVVDAIQAMYNGKGKVFFAMGGNFLSATPDTYFTAEAMRRCDLTIHVSTKLNRSHLVHGKTALILPCLGRTDIDIQNGQAQFVSVENSMGVVHSSQGQLKPPSRVLKSEVRIIAELAKQVLKDKINIDWEEMANNYDLIRSKIEQVIPGFDHYNERVRQPGGFYLPNSAREQSFNTIDQKALFTINELSDLDVGKDELVMMTIRSHDQYNTTIYGMDDRYRGILNERRVVLMNAQDIEKYQLAEKELVNVVSTYDGIRRVAEGFISLPYPIPQGSCAMYFPEANVLVPAKEFARKSKTPISKSVIVKIEKRK